MGRISTWTGAGMSNGAGLKPAGSDFVSEWGFESLLVRKWTAGRIGMASASKAVGVGVVPAWEFESLAVRQVMDVGSIPARDSLRTGGMASQRPAKASSGSHQCRFESGWSYDVTVAQLGRRGWLKPSRLGVRISPVARSHPSPIGRGAGLRVLIVGVRVSGVARRTGNPTVGCSAEARAMAVRSRPCPSCAGSRMVHAVRSGRTPVERSLGVRVSPRVPWEVSIRQAGPALRCRRSPLEGEWFDSITSHKACQRSV